MNKQRRASIVKVVLVLVVIASLVIDADADAKRRRRRKRPRAVPTPLATPSPSPTPAVPGRPIPPPGQPGLQLSYVQRAVTMAAGQDGDITAGCPAGSKLLGGGAYFSAPALQGFLSSSGPVRGAPDTGWYAAGFNGSTSGQTLYAHAVCGTLAGLDVAYVEQEKDVPRGSSNFVEPACPPNTTLTGGGTSLRGAPIEQGRLTQSAARPVGSGIPNQGWVSWTRNLSSTSQTMRSTAICVVSPVLDVTYDTGRAQVGERQQAFALARCPEGRRALGGGTFVTGGQDGLHLNTSSGTPAGDLSLEPDEGWQGWPGNNAGGTRTIYVSVACVAV